MIPLRDNIPSQRTPVVNYLIIGACLVVFLLQVTSRGALDAFAFTPGHLIGRHTHGEPYGFTLLTIFTSMFMHGGIMHLVGNMLFLWIFGDNVEDRMGHGRYLVFYLICGVAAATAQALISGFAPVPMIGASGAIAGVLGAYFVLFRGATVRTLVILVVFITVIDIPAVVFLGLWFLYQLWLGMGALGHTSGGGVAFWAHIGGFLVGLLLVRRFAVMPRNKLPQPRILDVRY